MAKIEEELRSENNRDKGWLVFDLNSARDMLAQIAAMLHNEGFGTKDAKSRSVNVRMLFRNWEFSILKRENPILSRI